MVQDAEGEGTPCEDLFIYNRRQQKGQLHTSHQENDQESRSFMLYLTRNHKKKQDFEAPREGETK